MREVETVHRRGLEPLTSTVSRWRSTTKLTVRQIRNPITVQGFGGEGKSGYRRGIFDLGRTKRA